MEGEEEDETNLLDVVYHVLEIADVFSAECITNYVGYHHHENVRKPHFESHFQDDLAAFEITMLPIIQEDKKRDSSGHFSTY